MNFQPSMGDTVGQVDKLTPGLVSDDKDEHCLCFFNYLHGVPKQLSGLRLDTFPHYFC